MSQRYDQVSVVWRIKNRIAVRPVGKPHGLAVYVPPALTGPQLKILLGRIPPAVQSRCTSERCHRTAFNISWRSWWQQGRRECPSRRGLAYFLATPVRRFACGPQEGLLA
jgi:hypothetical protein